MIVEVGEFENICFYLQVGLSKFFISFSFLFSGNIETNHRLPPSHKSRNNLLRY